MKRAVRSASFISALLVGVVSSSGLLAGCGANDSGSSPRAGGGGVGGESSDKDGSGGAGTDGSGGSLHAGGDAELSRDEQNELYPPNLYELTACREYVYEQCSVLAECNQRVGADCWNTAVVSCPEIAFGPGSVRGVELIAECAERWKNASCAEALAYDLPGCFPAGTRENGEACAFSGQCASSFCTSFTGECGLCTPASLEGDICDGDGTCLPGLVCLNNQCSTDVAARVAQAASGGSGSEGCDCAAGYYCAAYDKSCQLLPQIGQACSVDEDESLHCAEDSYCNAEHLCEALPTVGQPCAHRYFLTTSDSTASVCDPALKCVNDTCVVIRVLGQSCGSVGQACEHGTACVVGVCEPVSTDSFTICE